MFKTDLKINMNELKELRASFKELAEKTAELEKRAQEVEEEGLGFNFSFTTFQKEIRESARKAAEDKLKPFVLQFDREHKYPRDFLEYIGHLGFMGVWLPEEYGGMGKGIISLVIINEEIASVCAGTAAAYADISLGALPILLSGTEEQKKKYLTKIAAGRFISAFAITEPESGSDAFAMKTTAQRDGDFYVLNGTKCFITNAGEMDSCIVFARVKRGDRGVAGFIVDRDTPGFSVSSNLSKMGLHCSDTRNVVLTNCCVHKDNLLGGKEGEGVIAVMHTFPRSRIIVGAQGVGVARGASKKAWEYAKQTMRFGRRVNEFQSIQHDFAEMALMIETAKTLVYKAAWFVDQGINTSKDRNKMVRLASLAKWHGTDTAFKVANMAVDICGGTGYMEDYGAAKYLRDAKALQIYEGTNKIQRNEIFKTLLKETIK